MNTHGFQPAQDSQRSYSFEFLTLSLTARERELERGLLKHLRDLLLELGCGFSFVGQVPLEVGGETLLHRSPPLSSPAALPLAEYALRDVAKPIGVSTYRVTRELPAPVRDELPTVEDLQEVVAKLRSEMQQLRKERQDE